MSDLERVDLDVVDGRMTKHEKPTWGEILAMVRELRIHREQELVAKELAKEFLNLCRDGEILMKAEDPRMPYTHYQITRADLGAWDRLVKRADEVGL